ncbi:protein DETOXIFICATION 24-like isoform X2 [Andrographis paniculata]|nr:protein DETOXIFICATION 24-like isoform X2 [Andrographis paniculata]
MSMEESLLSSKSEQLRSLKTEVWVESKKIWRVAMPSIISRVSSFGTLVVTQSFIGHVSSLDLAGYALVQTLIVRFINGILLGMSSATETLCGQAYGAKQYHMMGIYLQRSWLIDLITLTILLPILIFAAPIFKMLGQDPSVSDSAGYISLWFIPFTYGIIFSLTIQMYLQAQQKNAIIAWLSVLQFVVHILLSWLFTNILGLGVAGAMVALSISSWLVVLGEFVYIFCGWCPNTWKGLSIAAVKDLIPVMKLSISSGVMVCLELWYYAILVLVAGYMKNAEIAIAAFSVCLNITGWIVNLFVGLMGAACVRVANELGRGDAKAVKFSIKVVMGTGVVIGVLLWVLCLCFGNKLGHLFSDDEEVVELVGDLSVLLANTVLLGSIFPLLSGVAVGTGLQTKVAVINFICFYVLGLPIGIVLGYVVHLQVKGIWGGLLVGVGCQTSLLSFLIWRTNWENEV